MSNPLDNVVKEVLNDDNKLYYKDVFDEIIENLNEAQLNELIGEIENQKFLLKFKENKRRQIKAELKKEKLQLMEDMKREMKSKKDEIKKKRVESDDDEDYLSEKKKISKRK